MAITPLVSGLVDLDRGHAGFVQRLYLYLALWGKGSPVREDSAFTCAGVRSDIQPQQNAQVHVEWDSFADVCDGRKSQWTPYGFVASLRDIWR